MKRWIGYILGAILGGIYLSFIAVNPYTGNIPLGELILQLDGNTGDICLMISAEQLLPLFLRMLPGLMFCFAAGVEIYKFYSMASVYVFSRQPQRGGWYAEQVFYLTIKAFLFEFVLITSTVLISCIRWNVSFDRVGLEVAAFQLILYSLWILIGAMFVNTASILKGSSMGVMLYVLTYVLSIGVLFMKNAFGVFWGSISPIGRLILGWHEVGIGTTGLEDVVSSPMQLRVSVLYMFFLAVTLIVIGWIVVQRYEFLNEGNMEWD